MQRGNSYTFWGDKYYLCSRTVKKHLLRAILNNLP
jgi:hypothetical protein